MSSLYDQDLARRNYDSKYASSGRPFDDYQPAYRYGWEERERRVHEKFEEVSSDLERGWERFKDKSKLTWLEVKEAVRDAWHRFEDTVERDGTVHP